ncbi:MAG: BMP family ABC transporter substrate-binding protein [Propionibacteriaceae bacterium]|nr:BMP family ABC transporter substrate-binding protein [Propionibacteriaceae bacterium]
MKKTLIGTGLAAALVLAGCAQPPAATPETTAGGTSSPAAGASEFQACMVSDEGGFDDRSFNETSYKGMMDAVESLGIQYRELQSDTVSDYAGNVQRMVDAGCNIIVTVGFALGDATLASAEANPDIDYAIVDFSYTDDSGANVAPDNVRGLTFNTAQPSFLAGYLAASISESGVVGTYGGAPYPTVTIFMDGYAQGVEHYNSVKGADVRVVGYDRATGNGSFIPNNSFSDVAGAKQIATSLVAQGADVILPVAGPASEGGLQVAQESNGQVSSMWVDSDGFVQMPQYGAVIPTSVGKAMDVAVEEAITASLNDEFSNDIYVGTFDNEGVYLAPFHDFDSKISAETKAEIDQLKADIISGAVTVES